MNNNETDNIQEETSQDPSSETNIPNKAFKKVDAEELIEESETDESAESQDKTPEQKTIEEPAKEETKEPAETEEPQKSLGDKKIRLKTVLIISGILTITVLAAGFFGLRFLLQKSDNSVQIEETDSKTQKALKANSSIENQLVFQYTADGFTLTKVALKIKVSKKAEKRYKEILEVYLKGPYEKKYQGFYDNKIKIKGTYVEKNILILDLSHSFADRFEGKSLNTTTVHLYSFVNSFLANNPDIKGIQILIDGQPQNTLNGWIDISNPLVMNRALIKTDPS